MQPYLPKYNERLFVEVRNRLRQLDVDLLIIHGAPAGQLSSRRDEGHISGAFSVATREWNIAGINFDYKAAVGLAKALGVDYVILEQAKRHLETYVFLIWALFRGPRVAWRGHGRNFHGPERSFSRFWRRALLHSGSWFFAYTLEGKRYASEVGYPVEKVTVTLNTVDVLEIRRRMQELDVQALEVLRMQYGLKSGQTGLYLGGIDRAKGLDFLLEAVQRIRDYLPDFVLLVAGTGQLSDLVRQAEKNNGGVVFLGRVDGNAKTVALALADVMVVPQGVGLVATDALAASLPLVTTDSHGHGPEFGYLTPGLDSVVTKSTVTEFADQVVLLLTDAKRREEMAASSSRKGSSLSVERSAQLFSEGIMNWIESCEGSAEPSRI